MSGSRSRDGGNILMVLPADGGQWRRRVVQVAGALLGVLLLIGLVRAVFFCYVPPGKHLVIISKNGDPLDPGEVLAKAGQKGIQKEVLGEGYHFVWPIIYSTYLEDNTVVPAGQVGIVTAQGGRPPRDGRVLAEKDDEQGIRRQVLLPGTYRINLKGYSVKLEPMVEIQAGHVGIKRRLLGVDGATQFATKPTEKGIIKDDVLQPGIYPVNTREYEVLTCEVGIYQTTYHYSKEPGQRNTALTFSGQDGSDISLDCTIEWEIKPEFWPVWLTRFRNHQEIEAKVVHIHADQISRVRGSKYGARDFLDGEKREKFQADFRTELDKACSAENVVIRSAFIRNIIIPDNYLAEKRQQRLATETKLTAEELALTAQSAAEVAEAKKQIDARVAEVQAETKRLVAVVGQDTDNVKTFNEAEIEKLKAEYGAKIAELDAQRKKELGEAEAEALKLKETARSSLYKLKLDVFGRDSDAYLRYTMAQQLNPKMQLRLFQSGPGTLWTNMGRKDINFMLPVSAADLKPAAPKQADGTK
jgi:regulator of protease activity HflC (stomatin/prohibitin superfamily)